MSVLNNKNVEQVLVLNGLWWKINNNVNEQLAIADIN